MRRLFFAILLLLFCTLSAPADASLQYLYPTDCPDLDEKELDDGDTTSVDLTTTPTVCALEDLVGTGYEIGRVGVVAVGELTANTPNLEVGVKIAGSTYKCDRYLGFTGTDPYTYYGCDWESSPDTSSDWTITEINGMSLSIAESGADARVTQLFAVIETDEETDNHEGVLTPASDFTKFGMVQLGRGHFWHSPSDADGLSPAGTSAEMFLWERVGNIQDEGFFAGVFGFSTSDCVTTSSGYQSVVMRVQEDGDRYEVRLTCPSTNNVAAIGLYRYDDGTASTLVSPTAVASSDVSDGAFVIVRVSGIADPTFSLDMATVANTGTVYSSVISHTDNHANAIETSGRWGFYTDEDTGDAFTASTRFYGLEDSFGVTVTGIPTGYSARLIDRWGQTESTTSETSGTAVIPWTGFVDYHQIGLPPTEGHTVSAGEGYTGQIQIIDGSSVVVADTGLLTAMKWGQTWEYTADFKLVDYRLGIVEDSSGFSNQRKGLVWHQLDRPGTVTVTCSPTCGNNSARYTYADNLELKQKEYINVAILDNLDENAAYTYTVKVDGVAEGSGTLNTGPLDTEDVVPTSCFSSCINQVETPFKVADTIANALDCDFFMVQGDAPYTDSSPVLGVAGGANDRGSTHLSNFYQVASAYKTYRTDPYWRNLYRNIPTLFLLNDHEICNEHSQDAVTGDINEQVVGGSQSTTCQGWPVEASKKVYRYYSQYGNPDPAVTDGFYYDLKWGKSSHYFPDQVIERIPQSGDTEFTSFYGQGNPGPTLTNPDLEIGDTPPTGWDCFNSSGGACAAFLSSGSTAFEGSYGILFTHATLTSIAEKAVTITTGVEYTVTMMVFNDLILRVRTESNEAGTNLCTTSYTGPGDAWRKLSCVIPDTNTDANVFFQLKAGVDEAGQADDMKLTITGETQPTCSRNGGDLSQLDCSGEAFTSETVAFSTTLGMALFDSSWYKINSVVDADTLDMTEDIACSSCTSQTARLLKTIKSSHGRDQLYWLLNAWRGETNPLQLFWSSYPLWGHRHTSGIYKYTEDTFFGSFCADGDICGFGGEHDLLVDELEVLETSGTGKIVIVPVGDEHHIRFSKWSTFDIYELLVSGLSGANAAEVPQDPTEKETDYPGLSVKIDTGGQPLWGLVTFDTLAKTFEVETRNDNNRSMNWWDGSNLALGTEAWFASPRSFSTLATNIAFPEFAHNTTDTPTVVQMASGYCWKIGTNFDTSNNKTVLRRSGDTSCKDWISSSSYTFELTAKSAVDAGNPGQALILNSDESSLITISTIDSDNRGKIRECSLTGSPPTISGCATPTSDPYYGIQGGLLWDGNDYLYTWGKKAGTGNDPTVFYVGGSSVADGIDVENPYAVSTNSTSDHQPGKVVLLNSSNDLMAMWFSSLIVNENTIRESQCTAGGNSRCDSGEWSTPTSLVTDTRIYDNEGGALMQPDIGSKGDDTAVIVYVTEANANVRENTQLKYIYYNGTSWGSPTEIPNAGWYLKDARVFFGGEFYYISVIDESLDKLVLFRSSDGSTWVEADTPFESSQGKHRMNVSQIDENTIAVSYISVTSENNYIESDERNIWQQTVVQLWTHASGRWRIKNVNPYINPRINTVN